MAGTSPRYDRTPGKTNINKDDESNNAEYRSERRVYGGVKDEDDMDEEGAAAAAAAAAAADDDAADSAMAKTRKRKSGE